MPRYRKIPTGVQSDQELARALTDMGLKNVEVHAQAQPLNDWIGRATDVLAHVIVRREDLGASSDDLGFVRADNGTFDLIVSEIHLFRFDKKFLADLAARTNTVQPSAGPIAFAASISSPAMKSTAPPPSPAHNLDHRTHLETVEMLERVKRGQNLGRMGCVLYFVPIIPWLILSQLSPEHASIRVLIGGMVIWSFVYFLLLSIVIATRVGRVVTEFGRRFPTPAARAAALTQLKAVAQDQKHSVSQAAQRLIRQVEQQVRSTTIKPRPPQSPRGPGASAR